MCVEFGAGGTLETDRSTGQQVRPTRSEYRIFTDASWSAQASAIPVQRRV